MTLDLHDEYRAALAMRHTPGLGAKRINTVMEVYSSLTEAAQHASEWVARGLTSQRIANGFLKRVWMRDAEDEYQTAKHSGVGWLVRTDPRYPERLLELPDPPSLLYYHGNIDLLAAPCVGVVGSRTCTDYGLKVAREMSRELSENGVTVVSGMALGIDRQAHVGGLEGLGSSIAVLGAGLDIDYPEQNLDVHARIAEHGLLLTEYSLGTAPRGGNFPVRNRIISGLSLGVVVVEAAKKSGSLITARLALEQGREVFAVPGPVDKKSYEGCNEVLVQGGHVATNAQTVLEVLATDLAVYVDGKDALDKQPDCSARERFLQMRQKGREVREAAQRERTVSVVTHEPVESAKDEQAVPPIPDAPDVPLTDVEQRLMNSFPQTGTLHIDTLGREAGMAGQEVNSLLIALEIKGVVRRCPGMYYERA